MKTKIINVKDMSLMPKDMIEIDDRDDFDYLCGDVVFRNLKNKYLYSISDSVAYYIKE